MSAGLEGGGRGVGPAKFVRPGIGAAGAELGMTVGQVRDRLGKPVTTNKAEDGTVRPVCCASSIPTNRSPTAG